MESIHLAKSPLVISEVLGTQLVTHNNPFDPSDTSVVAIEPGVSCYSLLKDFNYDIEYYDLVISRNQEVIDTDFIIQKSDIVSFLLVPKGGGGGGNKVLRVVALIVVAVASYFTGGYASILYSSTLAGSIASTGVMIIGGMLINSMFKPSIPSAGSLDSFDNSTTYGWNVSGNQIAQGYSVPVLYGTTRVTPQYIGKYLETSNDMQTLKVLLAIGEGPFNSISEVLVNDTPISTFANTYYITRMGTNNQELIPDFNDTWSDQAINKKLTDTSAWSSAITSGDAVTSIGVTISCPQGVYYANDAGGLSAYSIYIDVEYRPVGGTWTNLLDSGYMVDTMFYYVDHNPTTGTPPGGYYWYNPGVYADSTGPYDVYYKQIIGKFSGQPFTDAVFVETVTTLPPDATGRASFMGQTAWVATRRYSASSYFTITDSKASAIKRVFKATNLPPAQYEVRVRFAANPNTSSRYGSVTYFEALQEAISDDFIYPNTGLLALSMQATDQLSGGFPKVTCIASRINGAYGRLDNPAWAALDLLMNERYGAGIPLSRIDFQAFSDWADYCTAEAFTVNLYIDQALTLVQNLELIGQLGRGRVIQYGSSFSVLVDKPSILPVQGFLFSMGNIIQNSFSETFLPLKDRANAIEVTYYDAENAYERTTIEVTQGNYDLVNIVNKTQLNLLGCTGKEQALRQAKYHLNQNRYLTITATWEASIDSIHCKVGDIVNVAHDVPQWGYSGRILGNTASTITVDRDDLIIEPGKTYYIQVSDSNTDEQVYVPIISAVDNVLTTSSTLGTLGEYSVYAFGEVNRHAKKMRILSISTAGDLKRKISAVEYNENVYNDVVPVPVPLQVQDLRTKDLAVSEYMRILTGGAIDTVVQLAWKGAALGYNVSYRRLSESTFTSAGIARTTSMEIYGLVEGELYEFMVDGVTVQYRVLGKTTPPDPVVNLQGTEGSNIFTLTWEYPYKPLDFKHFLIYNDGALLGSVQVNTFTTKRIQAMNAATFEVYAEDISGNISDAMAITVPLEPIPQVSNLIGDITNGMLNLTWNYIDKPEDFSHYNIYHTSGYIGNSTGESFSIIIPSYTAGTLQNFYVVVYDTSGNKNAGLHVDLLPTVGSLGNATVTYFGSKATIKWLTVIGSYPIDRYTVTINGNTTTVSKAEATIDIAWAGTLNAVITAYDTAGNTYGTSVPVSITKPSATIISSSINNTAGIEFSWTTVKGTLDVERWQINYNGSVIDTKDAFYFIPTRAQGIYTIQVVAYDTAGNASTASSKSVTIVNPSISNISSSTTGSNIVLTWGGIGGSFDIKDYVISYDSISTVSTQQTASIKPTWIGNKTFTIYARDIAGNSGASVQYVSSTTAPSTPIVNSSVVGKDMIFTTQQTKGSFDIAKLEVSYDTTTIDIGLGSATWSLPIFWDGSKVFHFTSIDVNGNRSVSSTTEVAINEASVSLVTAEVVDNNVLLRWTGIPGTLPIESYRISKGVSYATSEVIGSRKGSFTTTFESSSGEYTYWITPVDTAGNDGAYNYIKATVNQPPDFVLNVKWVSSWANAQGANKNLKVDGDNAILPINTTETYQSHFTSRSWATPNAQVTAGYPLWLTPSTSTSTYYEVFDYGAVLSNTSVTLTDPLITISGSGTYTMHRTISTSQDGVTYIDGQMDQTMSYLTNIRYVKVSYTFTVSNDKTILTVGQFSLRLDSKIKNDAGSNQALLYPITWVRNGSIFTVTSPNHGLVTGDTIVSISDSSNHVPIGSIITVTVIDSNTFTVMYNATGNSSGTGTYIREYIKCYFNTSFVDVSSIVVTASGTTPAIALYDFVDVANPMYFKVRLYDTNGNRISGAFSWAVRGY